MAVTRYAPHDCTYVRREPLLEIGGIRAEIVRHDAGGHQASALAVQLPGPRRSLSGRDGLKAIDCACNCYLPKSAQEAFGDSQRKWTAYLKNVTVACLEKEVPARSKTVLCTGVDMKNAVWHRESYGELWACAIVTAGIASNALRIGFDRADYIERSGRFEKAGTINTIILTGARLTPAALAASFVTATEAKVIALQDLDIRSVFNPELQASGTGTDQVLVISGDGPKCESVGGHTKLGEIMARAVTAAVTGAIRKTHSL